ncbi:hypothetical protein LCGC14_0627710 [marine sediment metagenome]|uniref:Uncharacterized protein n=1 Tax=marine sediment metagenome TaxID=412755 RepID=A0A0F9TP93_9ZZZZ
MKQLLKLIGGLVLIWLPFLGIIAWFHYLGTPEQDALVAGLSVICMALATIFYIHKVGDGSGKEK